MKSFMLQRSVVVLCYFGAVTVGDFVVDRQYTVDSFSNKTCVENSYDVTEKTKSSCRCQTGSGTFFSNGKTFKCYSGEDMKKESTAFERLNLVNDKFNVCRNASIKHVDFWNPYGSSSWPLSFQGKNFDEAIKVEHNQLKVVKRRLWNGLLVRIHVNCGNSTQNRYVVKFTGNRTYPIGDDIDKTINDKPSRNDTPGQNDTPNQDENGGGPNTVAIVIGALLVFVIAVIIFLVVLWRRKKICQKPKEDIQESLQGFTEKIYTEATYNSDEQQGHSAIGCNPTEQPVYRELETYQDAGEAIHRKPLDEVQTVVKDEDMNYYSTAICNHATALTVEYAQVHKKKVKY